jgi:hypothetical protein
MRDAGKLKRKIDRPVHLWEKTVLVAHGKGGLPWNARLTGHCPSKHTKRRRMYD